MSWLRRIVPLLWVVLLTNGGPVLRGAPLDDVGLVEVIDGFAAASGIANAGDGSNRLFVLQQTGEIFVIDAARTSSQLFLDISSLVSLGEERGLLGLTFHPDFETNGRFFIDYTDVDGNTAIAEYHADPGADVAAPDEVKRILSIQQPHEFHNGGALLFGPDGYLYIGMGDGGWPEDQLGSSQDTSRLLGGILRIDVDAGDPYAVPPDNPFVDGGGRPELWLYGLRNPWRASFDPETGDFWMGDVGQVTWEEVNVFRATDDAPFNYGWSVTEGPACFSGTSCDYDAYEAPVAWYGGRRLATGNCALMGGYVYRGHEVPALWGHYLYADYCSGKVWSLVAADPSAGPWLHLDTALVPTAFGLDETGELYLVDYARGMLYRFVSASSATGSAGAAGGG